MATIIGRPQMQLNVAIELNESEARALDALVGYGDDAFIKAFYEKLGEAYMKEHEAGLRSLFNSVRQVIPGILSRAKDAKRVFAGELVATMREDGK